MHIERGVSARRIRNAETENYGSQLQINARYECKWLMNVFSNSKKLASLFENDDHFDFACVFSIWLLSTQLETREIILNKERQGYISQHLSRGEGVNGQPAGTRLFLLFFTENQKINSKKMCQKKRRIDTVKYYKETEIVTARWGKSFLRKTRETNSVKRTQSWGKWWRTKIGREKIGQVLCLCPAAALCEWEDSKRRESFTPPVDIALFYSRVL